ncbi:MAG: agmatine deiminase family protein [Cellulomonas sp.]|jgi:agmatine deiminase|nr:agmatine deiminase family protein [Cellulomonas sp.]
MSSLSDSATVARERAPQEVGERRRLPSEREMRETTWLSWLKAADTSRWVDAACAAVATTAAARGPVSLLVDTSELAPDLEAPVEVVAGSSLGGGCLGASGPSFIIGERGVQAIDWTRPERQSVPRPRRRRNQSPPLAGLPVEQSTLDLGTIDSDGWGTALLASDTLERNPDWTRDQVTDELGTAVGVTRVVWLPRVIGDPEQGHGYAPAVFAAPGVVLVHDQQNIGHPDNETTIETVALLSRSYDAVGRALQVVRLPAPARLREDDAWLHWTYLGYGLVDGAVIVPLFDDPHDNLAVEILGSVFEDREIVGVDARPLFRAGHSVGCLLRGQPQPR